MVIVQEYHTGINGNVRGAHYEIDQIYLLNEYRI